MTDKEFRHMSRADLIDIIYILRESETNLREELEQTRAQAEADLAQLRQQMQSEIDRLHEKSEQQVLNVPEKGTLAQVLAQINGIFDAAQKTADQYIAEAQKLHEQQVRLLQAAQDYAEGSLPSGPSDPLF